MKNFKRTLDDSKFLFSVILIPRFSLHIKVFKTVFITHSAAQ